MAVRLNGRAGRVGSRHPAPGPAPQSRRVGPATHYPHCSESTSVARAQWPLSGLGCFTTLLKSTRQGIRGFGQVSACHLRIVHDDTQRRRSQRPDETVRDASRAVRLPFATRTSIVGVMTDRPSESRTFASIA